MLELTLSPSTSLAAHRISFINILLLLLFHHLALSQSLSRLAWLISLARTQAYLT